MDRTGKVTAIPKEYEFAWEIRDFSSLSEDYYTSPSFSFAGESWHLKIFPNGDSEDDSIGFVEVYLYIENSGPPFTLKYSMSLKNLDGKKFSEQHEMDTFEDSISGYGCPRYLARSKLLEMKSDLLPSDTLTIICSLKFPSSTDDTKIEKLVDDFKSLMENGDHSDTTIQVKGQEFRLHRNILGARNPFFDSMFKSDMKEKNTGLVTIDDCEPDVFSSFVRFLYTGDVGDLSSEKVCDVYQVADKYQEDQLKKECLEFMMQSISVEYF